MQEQSKKSNRLAMKLTAVSLAMLGFGYVLVPLYEVFCDITGLRFTDDVAQQAPQEIMEDTSRLVTVEFDVSMNQSMPWVVEPERVRMEVHPGKVYTTHYVAKNETPSSMIGQAVPSVTPTVANRHLIKTECFCFEHQPITAGGEVTMPLSFMINPKLPAEVKVVTLSYTFFDITKDASIETVASIN